MLQADKEFTPPSPDTGAASIPGENSDYWLRLTSEAYQASTSFIDTNYRSKWEDNLRHFRSQHAAGSKYNKPSYQHRSKLFRPKTRSMSRNFEAACAAAFFANADLVDISPANPEDPIQAASAAITFELLQHHLTVSIPWFVLCLGAGQEAHRMGCVFSYQNWDYVEKPFTYKVPAQNQDGTAAVNELTGQPVMTTATENKVLKDCPKVELLPPENVRFHPAAKWYDPINTSPYLQLLWPMFVRDVKARMVDANAGKVPEQKWKRLDDKDIAGALRLTNDRTRQVREGEKEDATDKAIGKITEFDVVWCIENFFNVDGQDVVWWTLGTEHMLCEPVPIEEVYWTGERPCVMGIAAIETFIAMPEGPVGHVAPLNKEINEVANQRMDNVSLVMNKKYWVKHGSNVDLRSLLANVGGGVVNMPDIEGHVKEQEFQDVTASAYQEHDRLNTEFDELGGSFSQSSVMTNRKLNETVGGMNMLRSGAGEIRELTIRTFSETWAEKVMRQLVKLIQKYESNIKVIALAGQKAQIFKKYGVDRITDDLLNQDLLTTVNVGTGSTDPVGKLQKFMMALDSVGGIAERQIKMQQPVFKLQEIGNEIFGRIGLKSGSRFLVNPEEQNGQIDPAQVQQIAAENEQLKAALQEMQMALKDKSEDRQLKLITQQEAEKGQDRRKAAELEVRLAEKKADLANPVSGEKQPMKEKAAA